MSVLIAEPPVSSVASLALCCPDCGHALAGLDGDSSCCGCGIRFPLDEGGVRDLRPARHARAEFSRLWSLWEEGRLGDRGLLYRRTPGDHLLTVLDSLGMRPHELAGLRILEVGMGSGRLLAEIQRYNPSAVGAGLERPLLSSNLRPGTVYCADLFHLPFRPEQFDLVICKSVLQHTPDPAKAFACLAAQVAPGGRLYINVFEKGMRCALFLRAILPFCWLYPERVCLAIAAAVAGARAALFALRRRMFDREAIRLEYGLAKLGTFDSLQPRHAFRFNPGEVLEWFRTAGFPAERTSPSHFVGRKSASPVRTPRTTVGRQPVRWGAFGVTAISIADTYKALLEDWEAFCVTAIPIVDTYKVLLEDML